jgi:hypothetical protein
VFPRPLYSCSFVWSPEIAGLLGQPARQTGESEAARQAISGQGAGQSAPLLQGNVEGDVEGNVGVRPAAGAGSAPPTTGREEAPAHGIRRCLMARPRRLPKLIVLLLAAKLARAETPLHLAASAADETRVRDILASADARRCDVHSCPPWRGQCMTRATQTLQQRVVAHAVQCSTGLLGTLWSALQPVDFVHSIDQTGDTPLHRAAVSGKPGKDVSVLGLLLAGGARVEVRPHTLASQAVLPAGASAGGGGALDGAGTQRSRSDAPVAGRTGRADRRLRSAPGRRGTHGECIRIRG